MSISKGLAKHHRLAAISERHGKYQWTITVQDSWELFYFESALNEDDEPCVRVEVYCDDDHIETLEYEDKVSTPSAEQSIKEAQASDDWDHAFISKFAPAV